jgi:hypothetical protein
LKSTAQTIAKVATKGYIKDLTSVQAKAKKTKNKKPKNVDTPHNLPNHSSPNNIFTLDDLLEQYQL